MQITTGHIITALCWFSFAFGAVLWIAYLAEGLLGIDRDRRRDQDLNNPPTPWQELWQGWKVATWLRLRREARNQARLAARIRAARDAAWNERGGE